MGASRSKRRSSSAVVPGHADRREREIPWPQSSLPGLTPQVGFTGLAAHNDAQLGQARVAVQSILFAKSFLRRGWTTRNRVYPISGTLSAQVGKTRLAWSSPRVTERR